MLTSSFFTAAYSTVAELHTCFEQITLHDIHKDNLCNYNPDREKIECIENVKIYCPSY